jgi:hypothetical protein
MVAFRVLYCFVILRHCDRKILQVNVTVHPSAEGTARQVCWSNGSRALPATPFKVGQSYQVAEADEQLTCMGVLPLHAAYSSSRLTVASVCAVGKTARGGSVPPPPRGATSKRELL